MTQVSGVDVVVAAYQESTFGADPTSADGRLVYFKPPLNLSASQNMIESEIMVKGRGLPRPSRGNIAASGTLETTLAPTSIGFWLKQILGAPATTEAAPYTHVFKPTALPSFILERDFTAKIATKVDRFNGCKVASATFNFPQQGAASVSMQIEGKRYTVSTAALDATLTDTGHVEWSGFQGVVKRGGSQIGGVLSATVQVENEMNTDTYCFPASGETPGQRFSLSEGRARISGTIETVFNDFTLIDLAAAGTATSFSWTFTHGTGAGTAGNEQMIVEITDCEIPLTAPTIETPAGLRVSIPFMGYLNSTELGLKITLKNAIAGASL